MTDWLLRSKLHAFSQTLRLANRGQPCNCDPVKPCGAPQLRQGLKMLILQLIRN